MGSKSPMSHYQFSQPLKYNFDDCTSLFKHHLKGQLYYHKLFTAIYILPNRWHDYELFLPSCAAAAGIQTLISLVAPPLMDPNPGHFTDWATAAEASWALMLKASCLKYKPRALFSVWSAIPETETGAETRTWRKIGYRPEFNFCRKRNFPDYPLPIFFKLGHLRQINGWRRTDQRRTDQRRTDQRRTDQWMDRSTVTGHSTQQWKFLLHKEMMLLWTVQMDSN